MTKVSIIIPTYNAVRFIGRTIESVLQQSFTDYDVTVVDDGSTDDTKAALRPFLKHIRYVYQENSERSAARNRGIRESAGEYLIFLDSDDVLLPDKLTLQVAALDTSPHLAASVSGYQYIDVDGCVLGNVKPWQTNHLLSLEGLLRRGLAPPHAVLIRRSWIERLGGFDTELDVYGAEDMDLWFRLCLAGGEMAWFPKILCQYRIHNHNTSRNVRQHYRSLYLVLNKLFASPQLPPEVAEKRNQFLAFAYLAEAGRLYGTCDFDDAKSCLRQAIELDPSLMDEGDERIVNIMVSWEQSIWTENPKDSLQRVLENLPTELVLSAEVRRQILLKSTRAAFYRAFEMRDRRQVKRLWARLSLEDPNWLFSRGNWSILLRSLGLLPINPTV